MVEDLLAEYDILIYDINKILKLLNNSINTL